MRSSSPKTVPQSLGMRLSPASPKRLCMHRPVHVLLKLHLKQQLLFPGTTARAHSPPRDPKGPWPR